MNWLRIYLNDMSFNPLQDEIKRGLNFDFNLIIDKSLLLVD